MRIPKEFFIKGKRWRVEYKWGLRSGGEILNGLMDPDKRVITLRRELTLEEKPAVFLHEFIHAVLFEAHLSYNDGWVDPLVEEVLCDALSTSLLEGFHLRIRRGPK